MARRYSVNANLIHKWLRDPRFVVSAAAKADFSTDAGLLRDEIEDAEVVSNVTAPFILANVAQTPLRATRVDLTLSDDRWVLIGGPTALCAEVRLVDGLIA